MKKLLYQAGIVILAIVLVVVCEFRALSNLRDCKVIDPSMQSLWSGETGECYAIDHNNQFIGDSRFPERLVSSEGVVDTYATKQALAGKSGWMLIQDYGGAFVLSAYTPAKDTDGNMVAVIAERDAIESIKWLAWPGIAFLVYSLFGLVVHRE